VLCSLGPDMCPITPPLIRWNQVDNAGQMEQPGEGLTGKPVCFQACLNAFLRALMGGKAI